MTSKRVGAGKMKPALAQSQTVGALRGAQLSLSPEIPLHFLFRPASRARVEPSLAHALGAPQPLALQFHRSPAEGSLPLLMDLQAPRRLQNFFASAGPRLQQASRGAEASGGLQPARWPLALPMRETAKKVQKWAGAYFYFFHY